MSSIDLEHFDESALLPYHPLDEGGALVRLGDLNNDNGRNFSVISSRFHEIFTDTTARNSLIDRGFGEEIAGYGHFEQNIHAHLRSLSFQNPGRAVIVDNSGKVSGEAIFTAQEELWRLRTPLPARLAVGPLATKFSGLGSHIKAWTAGEPGQLKPVYREMIARTQITGRPSWTIEPVTSSPEVHEEIQAAGMTVLATGRFTVRRKRAGKTVDSVVYVQKQQAA